MFHSAHADIISIYMISKSQISQTQTEKPRTQQKFDGLSNTQIWAYGMGHFLNDLTAGCWFNYLLFFLKTIVKTSAASTALLSGQLCDGIATPIVGYLSDKSTSRFGKRTPWYVLGLGIIMLTFLPIFIPYRSQIALYQYLYYSIFPGLFNVGWACLQISHMSLVPSLTCSRKRRDKLNNYRNTFTFLANLVVLTFGLFVFFFMADKEKEYKVIALLVLGIGLLSSLFFLLQVKQPELAKICQQKKEAFKLKISHVKNSGMPNLQSDEQLQSDRKMKSIGQSTIDDQNGMKEQVVMAQEKKEAIDITFWLKKPKFYLFGICYMCVRLNSNIFGTFLPFYLINVLKIQKFDDGSGTVPFSVALVPLIIYFSSSLISPKLTFLYSKLGRGKTLLFGAIIQAISLTFLYFLNEQNSKYIYLLSVFIGISQSMVLSTGINLISDVIGSKGQSGALVFGIYSFLDKISAGIVIFIIANLPSFTYGKELTTSDDFIIKGTIIFIPILSVFVSALITFVYNVSQYLQGSNQKLSQSKMENQEFVHSVTMHAERQNI